MHLTLSISISVLKKTRKNFSISGFWSFHQFFLLMELIYFQGYSQFSHCIVLLVGTFIHTSHDHFIFYLLWTVLGSASGLKIAYIVFNNTQHPTYKTGLAISVYIINMLFLLYTHFAYHELAEGKFISSI